MTSLEVALRPRAGSRPPAARLATLLVPGLLLTGGCASVGTTRFVNPNFDFAYVRKVAVLPFENLANEPQAGARATRLFITELLATGSVEVVEPGEVRAALARVPGAGATPSTPQLVALGKELGVQAIVMGSVNQSEEVRTGTVSIPVVTLDVHMVEVETGSTVWAATRTEKGAGFGAKFLGTGGEPISETTRRCVRELVKNLVR